MATVDTLRVLEQQDKRRSCTASVQRTDQVLTSFSTTFVRVNLVHEGDVAENSMPTDNIDSEIDPCETILMSVPMLRSVGGEGNNSLDV